MQQGKQREFLQLLTQEARYQSELNQKPLLPHQLDGLASFVASHTWQVVSVLAATSALIVEVVKRL
jgi:hypothetical protein